MGKNIRVEISIEANRWGNYSRSYDQGLSIISMWNSRYYNDGFHVSVVLVLVLMTVIHYHYSTDGRVMLVWMAAIGYPE